MANGGFNDFLDAFGAGFRFVEERRRERDARARQDALDRLAGLVPTRDLAARPSDAGLAQFLAETAPPDAETFDLGTSLAGATGPDASGLPGNFNLRTGQFNPIGLSGAAAVATPGFNPNEPHPLAAVAQATRGPLPPPLTRPGGGSGRDGASELFQSPFPDAFELPGTEFSFVPSLTAAGRQDALRRAETEAERQDFLAALGDLEGLDEPTRARATFAARFDVDKALGEVLEATERGDDRQAQQKAHEVLTSDPLTAPFYQGIPFDPSGETDYIDALLEARGDLAGENRIRTRPRTRAGGAGGGGAGGGGGGGGPAVPGAPRSVVGAGKEFRTISELDRAADAAAASIPTAHVTSSLQALQRLPANVRTAYQNRMILALTRRLEGEQGEGDDSVDAALDAYLESIGQGRADEVP